MYQIVKASNRSLAWCEIIDGWTARADASTFDSVDVAHDAAEMQDGIPAGGYILCRVV
jgi:hypothetical protein